MAHEIWDILKKCEGFDWDEANSEKNWLKHQVRKGEAEQVFFNHPLIVAHDEEHSICEQRFLALGQTRETRLLTLIFTIRKEKLIRIISARPMKKKQKKIPKFTSEKEEQEFWDKSDATEYFDIEKGKKMRLPNLKPSTKTISLRLTEDLLEEIKIAANKRDIPYQSYIKMILREKTGDDAA